MNTLNHKDQIIVMLQDGKSYNQIAQTLGCSKATISYHAKRIGKGHNTTNYNVNRRYNWKEVQEYYDEGYSVRSCMKHFGFTAGAWEKAKTRGDIITEQRTPTLEQLLVERRADNKQTFRSQIRRRLAAAGLLETSCEKCGISKWMGEDIVLELDHINGKRNDNRLENLRVLCPNCHSQTPTHRSKNKRYQKMAPPGVEPGTSIL